MCVYTRRHTHILPKPMYNLFSLYNATHIYSGLRIWYWIPSWGVHLGRELFFLILVFLRCLLCVGLRPEGLSLIHMIGFVLFRPWLGSHVVDFYRCPSIIPNYFLSTCP